MAGSGDSVRAVVFALVANLVISIAKLVAWIVTGSGSMLAEAVHSFADTSNQGLLLLGHGRSKRPADEDHPLGYGREAYFWAMLVAVMLFFLGGAFALYEGVHKLMHPVEVTDLGWAIGVLIFAIVVDSFSLNAAWQAFKGQRRGRRLRAWARDTGDVNLLVVLYEDIAAVLGMVIALVAVVLAAVTKNPIFDALGTCAIGLLLLAVSVFLAIQIRRLVVGFRAGHELQRDIRAHWEADGFDVLDLIATWSGPQRVMVALKVRPRDLGASGEDLIQKINASERTLVRAHPEIAHLFVEPDISATGGVVA